MTQIDLEAIFNHYDNLYLLNMIALIVVLCVSAYAVFLHATMKREKHLLAKDLNEYARNVKNFIKESFEEHSDKFEDEITRITSATAERLIKINEHYDTNVGKPAETFAYKINGISDDLDMIHIQHRRIEELEKKLSNAYKSIDRKDKKIKELKQ